MARDFALSILRMTGRKRKNNHLMRQQRCLENLLWNIRLALRWDDSSQPSCGKYYTQVKDLKSTGDDQLCDSGWRNPPPELLSGRGMAMQVPPISIYRAEKNFFLKLIKQKNTKPKKNINRFGRTKKPVWNSQNCRT